MKIDGLSPQLCNQYSTYCSVLDSLSSVDLLYSQQYTVHRLRRVIESIDVKLKVSILLQWARVSYKVNNDVMTHL